MPQRVQKWCQRGSEWERLLCMAVGVGGSGWWCRKSFVEVVFELGIKGLYCIGQNVLLGFFFFIRCYRKTWTKFLTNPILLPWAKSERGIPGRGKSQSDCHLIHWRLQCPTSQASSAGALWGYLRLLCCKSVSPAQLSTELCRPFPS